MREKRLSQIVYYLLNNGKATAPELAEKFGVSIRTIYRDLDELNAAGIPVHTQSGRNGGIHLMPGISPNQTLFSEEEKQHILTMLQKLTPLPHPQDGATLDRISTLLQPHSDTWLEVDFSGRGETSQNDKKFEAIKSAILQQKCVRITYAGPNESFGERIVCPIKLIYKFNAWYLRAYCTKRCAFRIFKLTCILDWQVLKNEFSPEQLPEPVDPPQPECKHVRLLLRFPKEAAYRVFDEFDVNQINCREDGSLIVSAKLPEDAWLTGYLLSFGAQLEILEPVYLKEMVARQARKIFEKNQH